jgi:transcription antitermination factor NusG
MTPFCSARCCVVTPFVVCYWQERFNLGGNVNLTVREPYPEVAISGIPLWFALTVAPKYEQRSARMLSDNGFEAYLPLHRPRLSQTSRRVREQSCACGKCGKCRARTSMFKARGEKELAERPLFPGYLFCRFPFIDKASVVNTLGVYDVVQFGPVPIAIPDDDIARVREMIASGLPIEVEPLPLVPHKGQHVRVCNGALFSGETGDVQEIRKNSVVIMALGRRITVKTSCLEEIPPPASRKRFPVCA